VTGSNSAVERVIGWTSCLEEIDGAVVVWTELSVCSSTPDNTCALAEDIAIGAMTVVAAVTSVAVARVSMVHAAFTSVSVPVATK
jgi:hypothetical protein